MKKGTWFLGLLVLLAVTACGGGETTTEQLDKVVVQVGNPAIDGLSKQIAENPKSPDLYAARAAVFYENEGYDNAIMDLKEAITMDSTNIGYLHLLADVYMDYFRSRLALETMQYTVRHHPEHVPSLLKLSEFYLILRQYNASLKVLDQALKEDPQEAEAYFMMGMTFKEMGDTARAINSFQESVEYDSELLDGWVNLGMLFAAIENPSAIQYFDNAIRVDSTNISALHAKAYHLANDLGRLEDGIKWYRKISRIDPQYDQAYFNSGLLYLDLGEMEEALKNFELTVKMSPTHIRGYYFKGLAHESLGNLGQAQADYEQALRMASNYEDAQAALARVKGR